MLFGKRNRLLFVAFLCSFAHLGFSQEELTSIEDSTNVDSLNSDYFFSGTAYVTTNGIAPAPIYSIDQPAAILNLSIGNRRWTFDPKVRFAADGTPWFLFLSGSYTPIIREKYRMNIGVHPFLTFGKVDAIVNNEQQTLIQSYRNLSVDHTQEWKLGKHFRVGTYYFYSHCFDIAPTHINFWMLTTSLVDLNLFKGVQLHIHPKVYLITADNEMGVYFNPVVQLTWRQWGVETIINQRMHSELFPDRPFIWNLSLTYRFKKTFKGQRPRS